MPQPGTKGTSENTGGELGFAMLGPPRVPESPHAARGLLRKRTRSSLRETLLPSRPVGGAAEVSGLGLGLHIPAGAREAGPPTIGCLEWRAAPQAYRGAQRRRSPAPGGRASGHAHLGTEPPPLREACVLMCPGPDSDTSSVRLSAFKGRKAPGAPDKALRPSCQDPRNLSLLGDWDPLAPGTRPGFASAGHSPAAPPSLPLLEFRAFHPPPRTLGRGGPSRLSQTRLHSCAVIGHKYPKCGCLKP